MEDMDYYEYEESKKRFTFSKIIKFIFKFIAGVIICGTFALLLGRMFLMEIPKPFKGVTWTSTAAELFSEGKLQCVTQGVLEPYAAKGIYHVSNTALVYPTPEADKIPRVAEYFTENYSEARFSYLNDTPEVIGEVQFTVRYNSRSTINRLMRLYSLTERPNGEAFVYILYDNNGNKYTEYIFAEGQKPLYEFRRIVFPGVDLSNVKNLYLDVYYIGDVRKPTMTESAAHKTMYANFMIYTRDYPTESVEFKKAGKPPLTFTEKPAYTSMSEE